MSTKPAVITRCWWCRHAARSRRPAPKAHDDQDRRECQELADFDAHVESEQVRQQAIRAMSKSQDLGRQAEAVEEAEDRVASLGVRLKPEPALVGAHIVERLVDDGEAR